MQHQISANHRLPLTFASGREDVQTVSSHATELLRPLLAFSFPTHPVHSSASC